MSETRLTLLIVAAFWAGALLLGGPGTLAAMVIASAGVEAMLAGAALIRRRRT